MTQQFQKTVLGQPLTATLLCAGGDWQVCVWGGDRPHIGSVTVATPTPQGVSLRTWLGDGHRDDVIGNAFAKAIAARTGGTVCVSCGVHYDGITKAQIAAVVQQANALLTELLQALPAAPTQL